MTKPLTRAQIEALAESLAAMVAAVERGELVASTALRHRLEGALVVLEVALGRRADLLEGLGREDSPL